jgi:hypothetical protein
MCIVLLQDGIRAKKLVSILEDKTKFLVIYVHMALFKKKKKQKLRTIPSI